MARWRAAQGREQKEHEVEAIRAKKLLQKKQAAEQRTAEKESQDLAQAALLQAVLREQGLAVLRGVLRRRVTGSLKESVAGWRAACATSLADLEMMLTRSAMSGQMVTRSLNKN